LRKYLRRSDFNQTRLVKIKKVELSPFHYCCSIGNICELSNKEKKEIIEAIWLNNFFTFFFFFFLNNVNKVEGKHLLKPKLFEQITFFQGSHSNPDRPKKKKKKKKTGKTKKKVNEISVFLLILNFFSVIAACGVFWTCAKN